MHPEGKILVAAAALNLRVKENPGVFAGAERDIRQEIDEAILVRLPSLRPSGKAGQSA